MVIDLFEWSKDLLIGIDKVDEQHHQLVEMINESIKLCFDTETIDVNELKKLQGDLMAYVADHFSTEEDLMVKHGLDQRYVNDHVSIHESFKEEVQGFFQDIERLSDPDVFRDVVNYLVRWLAYHILYTDQSLATQMNMIVEEGLSPGEAYDKDQENIHSSSEPLLKALKYLFGIVSEKNKELREANSELEHKVEERTIELQTANEQLKRMSMVDELTGLSNRRYAASTIQALIHDHQRYGEVFSVLYIDVDNFKSVNDQHGHDVGDQLLMWISEFLVSVLRRSDIPCRLGGDEFLIICNHCDAEGAMVVGEKLNALCRESAARDRISYWTPSLSIGVAEVDETIKTASDMFKKGDRAMYKAKNDGGGKAVG